MNIPEIKTKDIKKWSEEEIKKLREIYPNPKIKLREILSIFERSKKSICHKASRLGISRPRLGRKKNPNTIPRVEYEKEYYQKNKRKIMNQKNERQKNFKIYLINLFGGKCQRCGYNKCIRALDFHHKNRDKEGNISVWINKKKKSDVLREVKKCELLCSNCHREEQSLNS